jgi:hypothetical protein
MRRLGEIARCTCEVTGRPNHPGSSIFIRWPPVTLRIYDVLERTISVYLHIRQVQFDTDVCRMARELAGTFPGCCVECGTMSVTSAPLLGTHDSVVSHDASRSLCTFEHCMELR